jgi:hypothetical protein
MAPAAYLLSARNTSTAHKVDITVRPIHKEMTMANDQGYDCQQCGEHFDTRDQLNRHNSQEHNQTRQAGSSNLGSSSRNSSNVSRNRNSSSGNSSDRDMNS